MKYLTLIGLLIVVFLFNITVYSQENPPGMYIVDTTGCAGYKLKAIKYKELQYIQSFGNYLRVFTDIRMYLITETLTHMITRLPENFQRTHKSYIANLNRVTKTTNGYLLIEETKVPVSSMFKILVLRKLNNFKIIS